MAYHQPFQITGFHSCDREVGLKILNGKDSLVQSENDWDWLGHGVYFWEQNPLRALEYAEESAAAIQFNRKRIKTPFVLGAIIELGNCLNLIEPTSLELVKEAYESLRLTSERSGEPMKVNDDAKRELDCAVIKYLHHTRVLSDKPSFDTVRSPFHEGELLYETANFSKRFHIEICVRKIECIKGYFLPMPLEDFNPYLNKDFNVDEYLANNPDKALKLEQMKAEREARKKKKEVS